MDSFWQGILTSSIVMVAFLVLLLIFYYVSTYMGLKRRRDYLKNFQEQLKPGKQVLFAGGILGKIVSIGEEYVTVEIAKDNKIKVSRYGIQEIVE